MIIMSVLGLHCVIAFLKGSDDYSSVHCLASFSEGSRSLVATIKTDVKRLAGGQEGEVYGHALFCLGWCGRISLLSFVHQAQVCEW